MWKPWRNKNNYEIPPKPRSPNKQISMVWDYLYNHLPGRLAEQDRRIWWQDIKINFIIVLIALILAFIAKAI